MKYSLIAFIISLFVFSGTMAQMNKFPNGIYLSLEQLKNQTPVYDVNLEIIKRFSGDIAMIGGNDYKLESPNDSIEKKYIKKTIYAYVKGDSILLNCFPHKLQIWYARALTSGNFLVFKACMTNKEATGVAIFGGVIGGAIASGKRYLNVLSLRTGNVRELTKEYLIERLKDKQDLLDQYNLENENDLEEVMIRYVQLL